MITTIERVTRLDDADDIIIVGGEYYKRTKAPRKVPYAKQVITARNKAKRKAEREGKIHGDNS